MLRGRSTGSQLTLLTTGPITFNSPFKLTVTGKLLHQLFAIEIQIGFCIHSLWCQILCVEGSHGFFFFNFLTSVHESMLAMYPGNVKQMILIGSFCFFLFPISNIYYGLFFLVHWDYVNCILGLANTWWDPTHLPQKEKIQKTWRQTCS